jgi:hypothetical protein
MVGMPKFTKRAAQQIARLEALRRKDAPPGNYISLIGCEIDVDADAQPSVVFTLHYFFSNAEGVPEELQVECHGVKLAYNIPMRLLNRLQPSLLDFDGERFVFIDSDDGEQA